MKAVVDFGACMSNGFCVLAAPEVFQLGEDGLLRVLQEEPPEELRVKVEDAALRCPTQAITIVD